MLKNKAFFKIDKMNLILGITIVSNLILIFIILVLLSIIFWLKEPKLLKVNMYDDPSKIDTVEYLNFKKSQETSDIDILNYLTKTIKILRFDNRDNFNFDVYRMSQGSTGAAFTKIKEIANRGFVDNNYLGTELEPVGKFNIKSNNEEGIVGSLKYKLYTYYSATNLEEETRVFTFLIRPLKKGIEKGVYKALVNENNTVEAIPYSIAHGFILVDWKDEKYVEEKKNETE